MNAKQSAALLTWDTKPTTTQLYDPFLAITYFFIMLLYDNKLPSSQRACYWRTQSSFYLHPSSALRDPGKRQRRTVKKSQIIRFMEQSKIHTTINIVSWKKDCFYMQNCWYILNGFIVLRTILKGNSAIFKPGPLIYTFQCVNDSYFAKVV